ncbi:MAG: sulfurtransferase TusA family protein [Euryarchaeota archaeon]|nr:sulfurtransferase TusA family protein [Euryarchaeota archaeon]
MVSASRTLDVRGLMCPIPVAKSKRAIQQVGPGEVLEILSTDPAAKQDIPAWARRDGHELVEARVEDPKLLVFYVKRGV